MVSAFTRACAAGISPSSVLVRIENVASVSSFFVRTRDRSSIIAAVFSSVSTQPRESPLTFPYPYGFCPRVKSPENFVCIFPVKVPEEESQPGFDKTVGPVCLCLAVTHGLFVDRAEIVDGKEPDTVNGPVPSSTSRGWAISMRSSGRGWPSTGQYRSFIACMSS